MRWCPDHPQEHYILHASDIKPRTWEICVRSKVLHLTKLQEAHGLYLTFYGRLHVFQILGGHPRQLRHMLKGIGPDTCLWVFVIGENDKIFGPLRATAAPRKNILPEGTLLHFTAQVPFCKFGGGNEGIEDHYKAWTGKFLHTGYVLDIQKFETALGLSQGASQAFHPGAAAAATGPPAADGGGASQASQPGAAAAATGPPAAGSDAQVLELTRKISALEAQIERNAKSFSLLEERNAYLEDSLHTLNSKFDSLFTYLKNIPTF